MKSLRRKAEQRFLSALVMNTSGALRSVAGVRLEIYNLPDDEKDMFSTLLRRNELLHLIAEEYHANFIVVLDGRESESGGNFGDKLTLYLSDCAKITASAHIDEKHDGQLTLLFINLDIWFIVASGDIPVNIAHIIARLIFPDFGKHHAAALESGMVLSGKNIVGETTRLDFYFSDFLQKFFGVHNT